MQRQLVKCLSILFLILTVVLFYIFTRRKPFVNVKKDIVEDKRWNSIKEREKTNVKLNKDDRDDIRSKKYQNLEHSDQYVHNKDESFHHLFSRLIQNLTETVGKRFEFKKFEPLIPIGSLILERYFKVLSNKDKNFAKVVFSSCFLSINPNGDFFSYFLTNLTKDVK